MMQEENTNLLALFICFWHLNLFATAADPRGKIYKEIRTFFSLVCLVRVNYMDLKWYFFNRKVKVEHHFWRIERLKSDVTNILQSLL